MPLGLMPGMAYEEKETTLAPGDSVLLHSDGVVEAHDARARACSASRASSRPWPTRPAGQA